MTRVFLECAACGTYLEASPMLTPDGDGSNRVEFKVQPCKHCMKPLEDIRNAFREVWPLKKK
jgi:hypothetical protein